MRLRSVQLLTLLLAAAAATVACSSNADTPPGTPAGTVISPAAIPAGKMLTGPAGQATLDSLIHTVQAAHPDGSTYPGASNGHSRWQETVYLRPLIDGQVDVWVYPTGSDRDAYVTDWQSGTGGGVYLRVGDTWTAQTYNASDDAEVARLLGGRPAIRGNAVH